MNKTITELPERITTLLQNEPRRPYAFGFIGGSNTGKSFAIRAVSHSLDKSGLEYIHISLDNYQKGDDFAEKDTSPYKWDDPENFSSDQCGKDLQQLLNSQAISYPHFSLETNRIENHTTMHPKPIILFDGLFATYTNITHHLNYIIYFESPFYSRFLRRILRHRQTGSQNDTRPFKHMIKYVYPAHQKFVVPEKEFAHEVITTCIDLKTELVASIPAAPFPIQTARCLFQKDDLRFYLTETNTFGVMYKQQVCMNISFDPELIALLKTIDWESL